MKLSSFSSTVLSSCSLHILTNDYFLWPKKKLVERSLSPVRQHRPIRFISHVTQSRLLQQNHGGKRTKSISFSPSCISGLITLSCLVLCCFPLVRLYSALPGSIFEKVWSKTEFKIHSLAFICIDCVCFFPDRLLVKFPRKLSPAFPQISSVPTSTMSRQTLCWNRGHKAYHPFG